MNPLEWTRTRRRPIPPARVPEPAAPATSGIGAITGRVARLSAAPRHGLPLARGPEASSTCAMSSRTAATPSCPPCRHSSCGAPALSTRWRSAVPSGAAQHPRTTSSQEWNTVAA